MDLKSPLCRALRAAFKIETILFIAATLILITTEMLKISTYREFSALDNTLSAVHSGGGAQVREVLLRQLAPYVYFDHLFAFCALLFSISIATITTAWLKEKDERERRHEST